MLIDPKYDGITHINIYSKGNTALGKMLSNFTKCPIMTEDGQFMSVEGYWYFLSISETEAKRELLRTTYGFRAKQLGKEILIETNNGKNSRFDPRFEEKILNAIWYKFQRNAYLLNADNKDLPFAHYYNYGGKVINVGHKYQWMIDGITRMRNELVSHMAI